MTSITPAQRLTTQILAAAEAITEDNAAGRYIVRRVGHLPAATGLCSIDVCRHPNGGSYPAMLAIFSGPDGNPGALHRTYLDRTGRKADVDPNKICLGKMPDGGAVRLGPAASILGIAEGIETALAASAIFGVPVWAALNAGRLAVWDPPSYAREVIIFADNDESCVGLLAAFALQTKISGRVPVTIEVPRSVGWDWADVLRS